MNYYTRIDECKQCKRFERIHLGKGSYGWRFTFQYNEEKFYKTITEMKTWLKNKIIYDENDEKISYTEFWKMVQAKQKEKLAHAQQHPSQNDFMQGKYSFTNSWFC